MQGLFLGPHLPSSHRQGASSNCMVASFILREGEGKGEDGFGVQGLGEGKHSNVKLRSDSTPKRSHPTTRIERHQTWKLLKQRNRKLYGQAKLHKGLAGVSRFTCNPNGRFYKLRICLGGVERCDGDYPEAILPRDPVYRLAKLHEPPSKKPSNPPHCSIPFSRNNTQIQIAKTNPQNAPMKSL